MKPLPTLLLSLLLGAVAGGVVATLLPPEERSAPEPAAVEPDGTAQLRADLARLSEEVAALRERTAQLSSGAPAGARVPVSDIEEVVKRFLAGRERSAEPGEIVDERDRESDAATPEELLALLLDPSLDFDAQQPIWDRICAGGKLDEVIALMEQRAEEHANDPDAQVEVGNAYLQKIFGLGDGPEAGQWAMKADAAYDRALALDEHHWEARFTKAVSLSFWPPIFGKQKEAVRQFETLLAQQEEGAVQDRYSQTYVLLGNLYHQSGQAEKANAIWSRGLEYFPDDAELLGKFAIDGDR